MQPTMRKNEDELIVDLTVHGIRLIMVIMTMPISTKLYKYASIELVKKAIPSTCKLFE